MDGQRLVWSVGVSLRTRHLNSKGLQSDVVFGDFSDMAFEAIAAPY